MSGDRPAVIEPPSSEPHWVLTILAVHTSGTGTPGVEPIDVYETVEDAFEEPGDVRTYLSMLARETELIGRMRKTDSGYLYYVTNDGLDLLEYVGTPNKLPDGTAVDFDPEIDYGYRPADDHREVFETSGTPEGLDELGVPIPEDFGSAKARGRYFAIRDKVEYLRWLDRRRRREQAKENLPEPNYPDPWKDDQAMTLEDAVRTGDVPWETVESVLEDADVEQDAERRTLLMQVQLRLIDGDELAVRLRELGLDDEDV